VLQWFTGENLRCIEKVELRELKSLNVFEGRNGAGKTSILEGMHLLGRGRSFRTARISELQRKGSEFLRVVGGVGEAEVARVVGLEHRGRVTDLRIAGVKAERASALASVLPQLVIRPESQELVSGGSEGRRKILDWVLFHVEHEYGGQHSRYRRVLQQRNAVLRSGGNDRSLRIWDQEFLATANALHAARIQFFEARAAILQARIEELVGFPIELSYSQGWPEPSSLEQALVDNLVRDRALGFTGNGPHRADLLFKVKEARARAVLSRGESKLTILGLLLSLADTVKRLGIAPVLLIDDLASELDQFARERFFSAVAMIGCQAFVSTVDLHLIPEPWRGESAVFHVEQGVVTRMI